MLAVTRALNKGNTTKFISTSYIIIYLLFPLTLFCTSFPLKWTDSK